MPQVKVRHGLVTWQEPGPQDRDITETAFRGMVVSMPPKEAARLKKLGAVVDVGEELPLGGSITPIPSTASDAELIAWASVANRSEIIAEIERQPALGDRIMAAYEIVQKQMADQNELLGGLEPDIKEAQARAAEREDQEAQAKQEAVDAANAAAAEAAAALVAAQSAAPGTVTTSSDGGGGGEDELEDPDSVVKGTVPQVSEYLSKHPDQHAEILEAEKRRAAEPGAKPGDVRDGVLHAVSAAAAMTVTG